MADKFVMDMQAIRDRHAKNAEEVKRSLVQAVKEDCTSRRVGIGTDL